MALVSLGYHKGHGQGSLNNKHSLLTVVEVGKSEMKVPKGVASGKDPLLFVNDLFLL